MDERDYKAMNNQMSKAKEKAEALMKKMDYGQTGYSNQAKQCALIAVEEIINELKQYVGFDTLERNKTYWQGVKQELLKSNR